MVKGAFTVHPQMVPFSDVPKVGHPPQLSPVSLPTAPLQWQSGWLTLPTGDPTENDSLEAVSRGPGEPVRLGKRPGPEPYR